MSVLIGELPAASSPAYIQAIDDIAIQRTDGVTYRSFINYGTTAYCTIMLDSTGQLPAVGAANVLVTNPITSTVQGLNVVLAAINAAVAGIVTSLTQYGAVYASSSTSITSTANMTSGQILAGIANGVAPILITLVGTTNQITVQYEAGNSRYLFYLPQNINTSANVQFNTIFVTQGTVTSYPTTETGIANKRYVDELGWKAPVKAVATTNITLSGAQTIDGYSVVNADRILVTNQTSNIDNGIYIVNTGGAWTRALDFASSTNQNGSTVTVQLGTVYSGTEWRDISNATVGSGATIFIQSSGPGTYIAGTGLTLTGTTFSITNTGVAAASYGSASSVATFTVNAQGQLSAAASVPISIAASQVTSGILLATVGGTGNGFTAFTGPTTSTKTFTLPNASATILTDNAVVTTAQGGTGINQTLTSGQVMVSSSNTIIPAVGITYSSGQMSINNTTLVKMNLIYSAGGGAFSGGLIQLAQDNNVAVSTGHRLGSVMFSGAYNNTNNLYMGAQVAAYATQGFTASLGGTQLVISTTANGAVSQTAALLIDQNQSLTAYAYSGTGNRLLAASSTGLISAYTMTATNNNSGGTTTALTGQETRWGRNTIASIAVSSSAQVTITWATALPNAIYCCIPSVQQGTTALPLTVKLISLATTNCVVEVGNPSGSTVANTILVMAQAIGS